MVKIIAKFEREEGKRVKHYEIIEKDFKELLDGKEIFLYHGKEIDIHIKLSDKALEELK